MFHLFTNKKQALVALLFGAVMLFQFALPTDLAFAGEAQTNIGAPGSSPSTASVPPSVAQRAWRWVTSPIESTKSLAGDALSAVADATIGNALKAIGWLFFEIAGKFLEMMAFVLDMSIDKTVDSAMYKGLSSINVGWTAIRDITNMFFIFVLLYISILTILGLAGSNTKRWVANLIIAALLINFSLFTTQVVVDAGNILTVGFWNNIKTTTASGQTGGFAPVVLEGLKLQTAFNGGAGDNFDKAKIYFGGALVMFIAGYVLLAGAIMMIIRTVTLIILMIVSPFAFLGFALPKGGGFATKWLDKLIGATFLAPAFVIMLYINMIIIRSTDLTTLGGAGGASFAPAFSGDVSNFAIFYNFFVMIVLLLASLTVAHAVSNGVGAGAGGWAKKAIGYGGGAAFASTAYGLRRTVGAGADRLKNNERIQKAAQQTGLRGAMARATIRTSNAAAKSSFDARNAPGMKSVSGLSGVSFGVAGGAGGERARRQSNDQAVMKRAEELFPNNPVAQQNYLRNAMRQSPSMNVFTEKGRSQMKEDWKNVREKGLLDGQPSRFGEKPGEFASKEDKATKEKRESLEQQAKKKGDKEKLEASLKQQEELKKKVGEGKITPEAARAEGEEIAKAVKEGMSRLSTNERAELAGKHADNSAYINSLERGDLATIQRFEQEGKYADPVLNQVAENVMKGDNLKLQKHMMTAETQDKLFNIQYEKLMADEKLMENYNRSKERIINPDDARAQATKENIDRDHQEALVMNAEVNKQKSSARWQELFAKGANRTPQEETEFKGMTNT